MDVLTPPQQSRHRSAVAVAALVALVLVAGGFWWYRMRERTIAITDGTLAVAPQGRMISGFPAGLTPEEGVAITESYKITYDNGPRQPVVSYRSQKSLAENMVMFRESLAREGWIILQEDGTAPVGSLYAAKENEEVNVTFAEDASGSVAVTVAYALR